MGCAAPARRPPRSRCSAVLEGSTASLDDLRAGTGDEVAAASVRLSAQLLSQVPVLGRSPLQAWARLHTVAGAGSVPDELLGRPRDAESAARLRDLGAVVTADAPALLVAAVVHAELLAAAPFASHNGIVARAAERLVLVARGLDEKSLVVPEAGHLALRSAYEARWRGWRDGGPAGQHAWVLHAAEAYVAAAEASPIRDR